MNCLSGHRLHLEHLREPGFLARIVLVLRKGRANIRIIESRKRIPTFQKLLRSGSMCRGAWGCIWGNEGKTHTLMERKGCWEARNIGRLTEEICKDQVDSAQVRNPMWLSQRALAGTIKLKTVGSIENAIMSSRGQTKVRWLWHWICLPLLWSSLPFHSGNIYSEAQHVGRIQL